MPIWIGREAPHGRAPPELETGVCRAAQGVRPGNQSRAIALRPCTEAAFCAGALAAWQAAR